MGNEEARESRRMLPLADQTKTSIWPGVSMRMCLMGLVLGFELEGAGGLHLFSSRPSI